MQNRKALAFCSLIFLFFSVLAPKAALAIPLRPTESWYQKQTQYFQLLNHIIINNILEKHPNLQLKTTDGKRITFQQIKEEIKTVQYRPSQHMLLENAPADITCENELGSQWITKYDSSSGQPMVMTSKVLELENFKGGDARLALHEAISAIGIIDDEYQVTAPLFLYTYGTEVSPEDVLPFLNQVKVRKHAPRVQIDKSESCYQWKGHAGQLIKNFNGKLESGGTITGVGGGGSDLGMSLKLQLMAAAKAWWKENNVHNYSQNLWIRFFKNLNALGIEEANKAHVTFGWAGQFELKKSKRSGKNSIYIHTRSTPTESTTDQIIRHIYDQFYEDLASDEKSLCYEQIVWGSDLAVERKLISEKEADRRSSVRIKKQIYSHEKFLVSKGKVVSCKKP